jgi:hypothetical protein
VTFWFTPFPLSSSLDAKLHSAGLRQHAGPLPALPPGSVLLYSSPHVALQALRERETLAPAPELFLERYRALLQVASGHRLASCSRLQQLSAQQIAAWVAGDSPPSVSFPTPEASPLHPVLDEPWSSVSPLTALVTTALLQQVPACMDAYLMLEAQAERFGAPVDAGYGLRLSAAVDLHPLLEQWWLAEPSSDLTVLQLQQVEEELLSLFLANRQQTETLALLRRQIRHLLGLVQRQFVLLSRCVRP